MSYGGHFDYPPAALVRRVRHDGTLAEVIAVFEYAADAFVFVRNTAFPDMYDVFHPRNGRRIRGTTAHGHAIMESLKKAGRL